MMKIFLLFWFVFGGNVFAVECGSLGRFFEGRREMIVEQEREWAEVVSEIETANSYRVHGENKEVLGFAQEVKGGLMTAFMRMNFRERRPVTLVVWNHQREEIFRLRRPFHFFLSSATVSSGDRELGTIRRRFSLRRRYDICTPSGETMAQVRGPLFKPWKFNLIDSRGEPIGQVTKRWSGVLREAFTDADTFHVILPRRWSAEQNALFLSFAFLADLDCFEH